MANSNIDFASGMFGGIKSTWGGCLLLFGIFSVYSFFCMGLMLGDVAVDSMTLFFMAPFAVIFWPVFNILGFGCAGVLIDGGIIWMGHSFVRESENRAKWGGILCILVSLQCFLMCVQSITLLFALIYFAVTISPPVLFWIIGNKIQKRRLRLLEQQADEMERQRLLGQRKVEAEEYRKPF